MSKWEICWRLFQKSKADGDLTEGRHRLFVLTEPRLVRSAAHDGYCCRNCWQYGQLLGAGIRVAGVAFWKAVKIWSHIWPYRLSLV